MAGSVRRSNLGVIVAECVCVFTGGDKGALGGFVQYKYIQSYMCVLFCTYRLGNAQEYVENSYHVHSVSVVLLRGLVRIIIFFHLYVNMYVVCTYLVTTTKRPLRINVSII